MSQPIIVDNRTAKTATGELAHEGNRVPDIVALDERTWIVAWRAGLTDPRDATPTDQGSIRYARSSDGGLTWTPGVLAAATESHRWHYVIFLNDPSGVYAFLGRITITEDRDITGDMDGFPVHLVVKRSTDRGATWTDWPITLDLPGDARGVVVAGKPVKHEGLWLLPYWRQNGAGVLRSGDLRTWTSGALAPAPPGVGVEEPQIGLDPDGTVRMVTRALHRKDRETWYRHNAAYAATATSRDGGLTWSPLALDPQIPNYYVKTFFASDSTGRQLAIYNTFAGPFSGAPTTRPERYREVLHYKVREPGADWGPGRLLADGPRLTKGVGRGWDVYPSADEYAPGRFAVVWEHNQIEITVAQLDLSLALPDNLIPGVWTLDVGAVNDADGLLLRAETASPVRARKPLAALCDFTVEFEGAILDDSALDPETGHGVSLGTKISNGARRLMLTVQKSGVWTMRKGSSTWEKVLDAPPEKAVWRVTTDSAGVARLFRDGKDTGVSWVIQDTSESPGLTHWVTGTKAGDAATARIGWTRVTPTGQDAL